MKNLLLFLTFLLSSQISISQCETSATNFENNTTFGYDISGDVTVTLNTDNTVTLDLASNFNTSNGPDVRAYLVNSDGMSDNELKNTEIGDLDNIEFGLVGCTGCNPVIPSSGLKSFTVNIPSEKDIRNYDRVFFYCLQFNAFWDFGSFTSFSNANCSVLSIEDHQDSPQLKIYPNPAKNFIQITSSLKSEVEIHVFNILGKSVYNYRGNLNKEINVSNFKSGIYILSAITDKGRISKKLIIE